MNARTVMFSAERSEPSSAPEIVGGWLVSNDGGDKRRVRLLEVTEYAYSACSGHTYLWIRNRGMAAEIQGDHVTLLDAYFAEEAA